MVKRFTKLGDLLYGKILREQTKGEVHLDRQESCAEYCPCLSFCGKEGSTYNVLLRGFVLSAWLTAVTAQECLENMLRAASGLQAVWISPKVYSVPCRSQGRDMQWFAKS